MATHYNDRRSAHLGDVVAHWQSTRLQQSRVRIPGIPGQDWWLSPVTLLLGGKNNGWSGAAASTTSMAVRSVEIFKLGLWEELDLVFVLTTWPK